MSSSLRRFIYFQNRTVGRLSSGLCLWRKSLKALKMREPDVITLVTFCWITPGFRTSAEPEGHEGWQEQHLHEYSRLNMTRHIKKIRQMRQSSSDRLEQCFMPTLNFCYYFLQTLYVKNLLLFICIIVNLLSFNL